MTDPLSTEKHFCQKCGKSFRFAENCSRHENRCKGSRRETFPAEDIDYEYGKELDEFYGLDGWGTP